MRRSLHGLIQVNIEQLVLPWNRHCDSITEMFNELHCKLAISSRISGMSIVMTAELLMWGRKEEWTIVNSDIDQSYVYSLVHSIDRI